MDIPKRDLLDRVNHLEQAVRVIRELDIDAEDWCLVGSAVLALYGIRRNGDLDVCLRGSVYQRLLTRARNEGWTVRPSGTVVLSNIDFIRDEYRRQGITSEELLDDPSLHRKVGGIKVARLELEFAKRAWGRRRKELLDVPYMEAHAMTDPEWDWSLVKAPRFGSAAKPNAQRTMAGRAIRRAKYALRSIHLRASRAARIIGNRSVWPVNRPGEPLLLSLILWPPAQSLFDPIVTELAKQHAVESYEDLELDSDSFAALVRRVYAYEDLERWKIERKLHFLARHKPRLRLVNLWLEDPDWKVNPEGTGFVSMAGHRLKKRYRRMYEPQVPDYVHDVIIHTGDTHEHCQWIREVFAESAPVAAHAARARSV